jgi:hypothetical protein
VIRRAVIPVLAAALQLAAALLVLGRPDPTGAGGFLVARVPTVEETLAAVELLVWALVAASLLVGLAGALAAGASAARAARGRVWEVSVAAAGLMLLGAGLAHHATPRSSFGGGSIQEAQQAVGR